MRGSRRRPAGWSRDSPPRRRSAGIPFATNHVCGMFGVFFTADAQVDELPAGHGLRQRPLPPFLPRDAGCRHLPRALGLRGGLRLGRARRGGNRGDDRGRRARVRGDRKGRLMRALAWFLAAIFGTLAARGARRLAGVARRACRSCRSWPFHRIVSRFWQLLLLAGLICDLGRLGTSRARGLGLRPAAPVFPAAIRGWPRDRRRDDAADVACDGRARHPRAATPASTPRCSLEAIASGALAGLAVAIRRGDFLPRADVPRDIARIRICDRRVEHRARLLRDPFPGARADPGGRSRLGQRHPPARRRARQFRRSVRDRRFVHHARPGRPAAGLRALAHRRHRRVHRPAHGLGVGDQGDDRRHAGRHGGPGVISRRQLRRLHRLAGRWLGGAASRRGLERRLAAPDRGPAR